ncbi:MAG: D-ribose pyranase [Oscillospiraceae bacterium]
MTRDGILNPDLCDAIARCGHTDYFVIADPGLPLPPGVRVIDLALVRGIPSFLDCLAAVSKQLVIESYILAEEMAKSSPDCHQLTRRALSAYKGSQVPHSQLKELTKQAKVILRTGEATPYANVILVCGVNF